MGAGDAGRATSELRGFSSKLLMIKGIKFGFPGNGCGHSGGCNQVLTAANVSVNPRGAKSLPRGAAISVMGGNAAPAAAAEVTRLLGRSPMLGTSFQAREVDDGSCAARLQAFGEAVRSVLAPAEPARPAVWSTQSA